MSDDDVLPDTDDPYALLGVPEDADERTIKRAYAQRIKRWRPDRSPDEFRRIHEAFEAVRSGAGSPELAVRRAVAAAERTAPAAEEPDESHLQRRARVDDAVAAHVDAILRGDHAAAATALAGAIDGGIPLLAILMRTPDEHRHALATSSAVTWARMRANVDDDEASVTLELVLDAALERDDTALALRHLQDPALIRAAGEAPRLARVCLRAIAPLGWRVPAPTPFQLLRRYDAGHPSIAPTLDRVELELAAAGRCLASSVALPPALLAVFRAGFVADRAGYEAWIETLRADVRADARPYLAAFDQIASEPDFYDAIGMRLVVDTPAQPRDDAELQAMDRRLRAQSGSTAVAIMQLTFAATAFGSIGGAPMHLPQLAVLLAIAATTIVAVRETRRYRDVIRAELASVMVECGVFAEDVRAWQARQGKVRSVRYGRFADDVAQDRGLDLLGQLACMLHARAAARRDDDDDDEEPDRDD